MYIKHQEINLKIKFLRKKVHMKKLYKKTLSLLFSMVFILGFALTPSAHVYPDTEFHWAKSYIDAVTNEGLLSARSTGFFVPDVVITRAEAINALYVLADAYLPRESIDTTGFTMFPLPIRTRLLLPGQNSAASCWEHPKRNPFFPRIQE